MTPRYTPGPWVAVFSLDPEEAAFVEARHLGETVAILEALGNVPKDEDDANIRLAYAAPDLAGACKTILWSIRAGYASVQDGVVYDAQTRLAVEAIEAALQKAGVEPGGPPARRFPLWMPIESAPKDGRRILAFADGGARIVSWDDDRFAKRPKPYWAHENGLGIMWSRERQPTHWMPLPGDP